ncbi:MAG TPA: protein kinase [Acidimicrobiia bacterium]|jgi:serine/threonine-protein kinase|nr:protein kinase [Acidimicrobiia bacterium]
MEPAAPDRILNGRYRLLRPLARGGMASVWLGEDTLLARRVAVKTLHPELSADGSLRARFKNEAISSASIEDQRIVAVYDTGDDDGVAYIVMEFVDGRDLRRLLDEQGTLPTSSALQIARDVALALEHAHRGGIVHRDIKPANVLVGLDGRVKVTDFGIAKASRAESDLTSTGVVLGTARYLAPEQVRGEHADARADVYATGLVLYEMLAGRLPFHGDTDMAVALARLSTTPDRLPPGTPAGVAAIVERCLADDPEQRFPTARALAAAIEAAQDGDPTAPNEVTGILPSPPAPARPSAPPPAASPPRRQRRWVAALLLAAVLAGGGTAAFLLVRDQGGRGAGTPGAAPRIVAAQDFDPFGNDGQENHAKVNLAIDHNPQTAWPTEIYVTRDLGGGKPGVGIYVTLDALTRVRTVSVDTFETDWNGQIYAAAAPSPQLAGWGAPLAAGSHLGQHTAFRLRTAGRARVVLLWITYLPTSGELNVAEIHVS